MRRSYEQCVYFLVFGTIVCLPLHSVCMSMCRIIFFVLNPCEPVFGKFMCM
jgi:hypothetical protein